jgi:hypothetical protein
MGLPETDFQLLYIKNAKALFARELAVQEITHINWVASRLGMRREDVKRIWSEMPDLLRQGEERIHNA